MELQQPLQQPTAAPSSSEAHGTASRRRFRGQTIIAATQRAARTGTKWVEFALLQESRAPKKRDGAIFALNFFTFCMYLVSFTVVVMVDRQIETSNVMGKALMQAVPDLPPAAHNASVVARYLADDLLPALRGASLNGSFIDANRIIGAVQIIQVRAALTKCTNALVAQYNMTCLGAHERAPFKGPRTGATFEFAQMTRCEGSFPCIPYTRGRFDTSFERDGYRVSYYNDSLITGNVTYPMSVSSELLADYVDQQAVFVKILIHFFNPQYSLLTQMQLSIELPATGSVQVVNQLLFLPHDLQNQNVITICSVFVWIYCVTWIAVTAIRTAVGWGRRHICLLCQMKGTLASQCWKCQKPVELTTKVAACVWCQTPNPAIVHMCWKQKMLDPWTLFTFVNVIILVVARVMVSEAKDLAKEYVDEVLRLEAAGAVPNVTFDRPMELFEVGIILNTVNLLMAYTCIYRFIGRAAWSATFLRVFSRSGVLLVFFFMGFITVFFGFVLAFHLLLCEVTSQFSTIWQSFLGTFRAFMGYLNWAEVVTDDRKWVFSLLYVIFAWTCLLVMVNVLITLVSVEYQASTKQIHFDHEEQSLLLIFAPFVARVREKASELFGSRRKSLSRQREAMLGDDEEAAEKVKTMVEKDDSLNEVMTGIHEKAEMTSLQADNYFANVVHRLMLANQELEILNSFARLMTDSMEIGDKEVQLTSHMSPSPKRQPVDTDDQ